METIQPLPISENDDELINALIRRENYGSQDAVVLINSHFHSISTAFVVQGNFTIANLFIEFDDPDTQTILFQGVTKRVPSDDENPFRAEDIALARALKAEGIRIK